MHAYSFVLTSETAEIRHDQGRKYNTESVFTFPVRELTFVSEICARTRLVDTIEYAIAHDKVMAAILFKTQLRAFVHRANFAAKTKSLQSICEDTSTRPRSS